MIYIYIYILSPEACKLRLSVSFAMLFGQGPKFCYSMLVCFNPLFLPTSCASSVALWQLRHVSVSEVTQILVLGWIPAAPGLPPGFCASHVSCCVERRRVLPDGPFRPAARGAPRRREHGRFGNANGSTASCGTGAGTAACTKAGHRMGWGIESQGGCHWSVLDRC